MKFGRNGKGGNLPERKILTYRQPFNTDGMHSENARAKLKIAMEILAANSSPEVWEQYGNECDLLLSTSVIGYTVLFTGTAQTSRSETVQHLQDIERAARRLDYLLTGGSDRDNDSPAAPAVAAALVPSTLMHPIGGSLAASIANLEQKKKVEELVHSSARLTRLLIKLANVAHESINSDRTDTQASAMRRPSIPRLQFLRETGNLWRFITQHPPTFSTNPETSEAEGPFADFARAALEYLLAVVGHDPKLTSLINSGQALREVLRRVKSLSR